MMLIKAAMKLLFCMHTTVTMDLVKIKNTKVLESDKTLYLKVDADRNVSSNKEQCTAFNVVITDKWKQASKFLIRYNKDKDYFKVQFHCSDSDKKKLNLRVNDQLYLSTIKESPENGKKRPLQVRSDPDDGWAYLSIYDKDLQHAQDPANKWLKGEDNESMCIACYSKPNVYTRCCVHHYFQG